MGAAGALFGGKHSICIPFRRRSFFVYCLLWMQVTMNCCERVNFRRQENHFSIILPNINEPIPEAASREFYM